MKVVSGSRFLGGYIGDDHGRKEYVKMKVQSWVDSVYCLSDAAKQQPQAAYAALVKSIQCEWIFLQRVVVNSSELFSALKDAIREVFWPSLFGSVVSDSEADLFALPTRMGGMGVRDPVQTSSQYFDASRTGSSVITSYLIAKEDFSALDHCETFIWASKESKRTQKIADDASLNDILSSLDDLKSRAVKRTIDGKCSNWLNVVPVKRFHFDLSQREFRDAIAIRYHRPIVDMPGFCDGCDAPTSVDHALNCKKGGLVIKRHNEVRDSLGEIMGKGYNNVVKEPIVREPDISNDTPGLVADLAIRGLWQPQTEALLDVRVVDTDAKSYCHRPVDQVIHSAEKEKKDKYVAAVEARRGTFTPFVVSVDGYVGQEGSRVLKTVAEVLAIKWDKQYSSVIDWIRASMTFSIIRATNLCLRGSRVKWRSAGNMGFDDGVVLPLC